MSSYYLFQDYYTSRKLSFHNGAATCSFMLSFTDMHVISTSSEWYVPNAANLGKQQAHLNPLKDQLYKFILARVNNIN